MNELIKNIKEFDGVAAIDSRIVADQVGKDHKNLMRDIRRYIKVLEPSSNLSPADYFIPSSYFDENHQERPCYLVTRLGCDMVANKNTGDKGILFTARYVKAFAQYEAEHKQKMEAHLTSDELALRRQELEYHRDFLAYKERERVNKTASTLVQIAVNQDNPQAKQMFLDEAARQLLFPVAQDLKMTAGMIAKQMGTTAYNIGTWGAALGLKAPEGQRNAYGYWGKDGRYYYNAEAMKVFQDHKDEILNKDLGL